MTSAPRRVVDDLAASSCAISELMLEVAPTYLSSAEAATGALALLCRSASPSNKGSLPAATRCPATAAPCTTQCCSRRGSPAPGVGASSALGGLRVPDGESR